MYRPISEERRALRTAISLFRSRSTALALSLVVALIAPGLASAQGAEDPGTEPADAPAAERQETDTADSSEETADDTEAVADEATAGEDEISDDGEGEGEAQTSRPTLDLEIDDEAPDDAAEEDGREAARPLVERGTEAFEAGDYARAASLFQEAFNLDPHPVLLFNIARAYEEMADLPAAYEFYGLARDLAAEGQVHEVSVQKIEEIGEQLIAQEYDPETVRSEDYTPRARIVVETVPEGATVVIDGRPVGSTPFRSRLLPAGSHRLQVSLDGYHPVQRQIALEAGGPTNLTFELERRQTMDEYVSQEPGRLTVEGPWPGLQVVVDGDAVGETPLEGEPLPPGEYVVTVSGARFPTFEQRIVVRSGQEARVRARPELAGMMDEQDRGLSRRSWGVISLGAGSAIAATGAAFGIVSWRQAAKYQDEPGAPDRGTTRDAAVTNALIGDAMMIAGVGISATGLILMLTADDEDDSSDDELGVGAGPMGTGGWGVSVSGRFR